MDNFYPRSPCGERRHPQYNFAPRFAISIHALLAESDRQGLFYFLLPSRFLSTLSLRRATFYRCRVHQQRKYFYPRSPCGERLHSYIRFRLHRYFYPRSPCGERRFTGAASTNNVNISIHALLAESDYTRILDFGCIDISIHALLAESDRTGGRCCSTFWHFYPRSPCGERRDGGTYLHGVVNFYPRSPCGERRWHTVFFRDPLKFLSTLSLRRATYFSRFYSRDGQFLSTLSLRRATAVVDSLDIKFDISIHALLAESDGTRFTLFPVSTYFYPRSPCGERL